VGLAKLIDNETVPKIQSVPFFLPFFLSFFLSFLRQQERLRLPYFLLSFFLSFFVSKKGRPFLLPAFFLSFFLPLPCPQSKLPRAVPMAHCMLRCSLIYAYGSNHEYMFAAGRISG
jgi:hypothetical protein